MGVPRTTYCTCRLTAGHAADCPMTTGLWPAGEPRVVVTPNQAPPDSGGMAPSTIALCVEIERLRNLARLVAVQLEALAYIDGVAAYEAVRDRLLVEMQSSPIEGVA